MAVTRPLGFRAAAHTAGIKKSGKPDMTLIVCDGEPGRSSAAAMFTANAVVGAPVRVGRRWRDESPPAARRLRAILVNSGNSNAATGEAGLRDAEACMATVAQHIGCEPRHVLPSSTGIIGHRLPMETMLAAIPALCEKLGRGRAADDEAAAAILTTDLAPKTAHREIELFGRTVHIGAIAKGSGMIAPRFVPAGPPQATMLAFITTDAAITADALDDALRSAVIETFERISVDAHTSCSDTVAVMASGAAGTPPITRDNPEFFGFRDALRAVCVDLAEKVVRDGEGATRIFRVDVRGAASDADAQRAARAVVDSPLVKCAIHGRDPNWGRIVTAAGNAVAFDADLASLRIGPVEVYRSGLPTDTTPRRAELAAAMSADPVQLLLTLGDGPGSGWMLGCDLSADYVRINADYST